MAKSITALSIVIWMTSPLAAMAAIDAPLPFGSQTTDWVIPFIFIAIAAFFICKSTGGGKSDGSGGGSGKSNYWGTGGD